MDRTGIPVDRTIAPLGWLGFSGLIADFLRDNMADSVEAKVQHKRAFAIVDEVDNILIDEARTPLIISGPSRQNPNEYVKFSKIAPSLQRESDYTVDEKLRSIELNARRTIEQRFNQENEEKAINSLMQSLS